MIDTTSEPGSWAAVLPYCRNISILGELPEPIAHGIAAPIAPAPLKRPLDASEGQPNAGALAGVSLLSLHAAPDGALPQEDRHA